MTSAPSSVESTLMPAPWFRILLAPCLALWLGCAGASTDVLYSSSLNDLSKPPVLLVDLFTFQADTVTVDKAGPKFASGDASKEKRVELGKIVAEAVAAKIVTQLGKAGIDSRRLEPGVAPPVDALIAKGQFVEINEGDQMARVTLGFGAGTEEIKIRAQLYHVGADRGLRRVREGLAEAHGDKMPGMAIPMAGGAAAGGNIVVSAAVSGSLNVLSEVNTGLDEAADNLAEQLAERVQSVYKDQGWID
jgi:hypothetical protein